MINKIKKIIYKPLINRQQTQLNKQYAVDGLTEEILEKQIQLNIKRHKLNITDKTEHLHEEYVQQVIPLDKAKKTYNKTRLRNLKRAKLKQRETELQLQIKNKTDDKIITQTMNDISKLKIEIKNLTE